MLPPLSKKTIFYAGSKAGIYIMRNAMVLGGNAWKEKDNKKAQRIKWEIDWALYELPRISYPLNIVSYYIKLVSTSGDK